MLEIAERPFKEDSTIFSKRTGVPGLAAASTVMPS